MKDNVRVIHLFDRKHVLNGGITVAYHINAWGISFACAICKKGEYYTKIFGRNLARIRLKFPDSLYTRYIDLSSYSWLIELIQRKYSDRKICNLSDVPIKIINLIIKLWFESNESTVKEKVIREYKNNSSADMYLSESALSWAIDGYGTNDSVCVDVRKEQVDRAVFKFLTRWFTKAYILERTVNKTLTWVQLENKLYQAKEQTSTELDCEIVYLYCTDTNRLQIWINEKDATSLIPCEYLTLIEKEVILRNINIHLTEGK